MGTDALEKDAVASRAIMALAEAAGRANSPSELARAFDEVERELPNSLKSIAAHAIFDKSGYQRLELTRNERVLLVLIGWRPGQRSEPHDHGGAMCACRILRGVAEERRHRIVRGEFVVEESADHYLAGSTLCCEGDDVHCLGAAMTTDNMLVTLHAYRPAPTMRTYRTTPGEAHSCLP